MKENCFKWTVSMIYEGQSHATWWDNIYAASAERAANIYLSKSGEHMHHMHKNPIIVVSPTDRLRHKTSLFRPFTPDPGVKAQPLY